MIDLKSNSGQSRTSMTLVSAVMLLIAGFVTACGGGGSSSPPPPSPPPPPPPPAGWQQGVFLDASTFLARCAAPRAGTGDIQGSTIDEKNFLRSYSNDTYLWYDQLPDIDPDNSDTPIEYFDRLTVGQPTDKFHFTFDTEEWEQLSQSGASAGYGVQFAITAAAPPRQILIAYTEPNSPATNLPLPLARGADFISVDGESVANGDAGVLNAAFFPSTAGETHTFEVLDIGAQATRMVTMTSEIVTSAPVQNTQVINTPTGDVGYMLFNAHRAPAEAELIAAINFLQGVSDLVLDIRYNGGGFLDMASQLAYMIAGAGLTAGQTFEHLQFNDKHPSTDPVTGQPLSPTPFHNQTLGFSVAAGQALPSLNLDTVYVLTGPNTCSASEAIMNGLRGVNVNVIQIGSTTCGKPYGFYPTDNCGTTYFTIQFRGVNAMNFGDYTDGFSPSPIDDGMANVLGCPVPDDFTRQLGDAAENRLEVALAYRDGQGCITPVAASPELLSKPGAPLWATDGIIRRSPWDSNRIYRR